MENKKCEQIKNCNSCYSCNSCKGLRMSEKMIFCLGEGKWESKGIGYQKNLMIFNKPVSEELYTKTKSELDSKNFKLPIAKWIDIKEIESPSITETQLGGMLKVLSYEDAWKELWNGLSQTDKDFLTSLPNFSWDIFTEITGIEKVEDDVEQAIKLLTEKGRIVDGKIII